MTKELTPKPNKISKLPSKMASEELTQKQLNLDLGIEAQREIDGVGMGVLSDGTPFLTGRGLARLIDIENLHIRTISMDWNDDPPKPRIEGIKSLLAKRDIEVETAHLEVMHGGVVVHAYPDYVCLAVLEYYAFDAAKPRAAARDNFRLLAGQALRELIYSQVGYDPTGKSIDLFKKWHERIELNHQSAPHGYFSVFNEAHTVIYELIMAGAKIDEKMVPDISIGIAWGKHWTDNALDAKYGKRNKFPHQYPDDHPQSKSNPQIANCYPIEALGAYRLWLQEEYIEGGKFANYLKTKAKDGLPPSVAQLAIERLVLKQLSSS